MKLKMTFKFCFLSRSGCTIWTFYLVGFVLLQMSFIVRYRFQNSKPYFFLLQLLEILCGWRNFCWWKWKKKGTLFDSYPNLSEHAIFSLVGIFVIVWYLFFGWFHMIVFVCCWASLVWINKFMGIFFSGLVDKCDLCKSWWILWMGCHLPWSALCYLGFFFNRTLRSF